MQNKKFIIVVILVIIVLIFGGYYFLNKSNNTETPFLENTQQEEEIITTTLSEEIDQSKQAEYLEEEAYLAKLPIGAEMNSLNAVETGVFGLNGQICIGFTLKKDVAPEMLATTLYDVSGKVEARVKSVYPSGLESGKRFGCEELRLSVGNYEYKVYIEDSLVKIIPFEVK
ncbi:hypothetical protein ACFLYY_01080 [Patescibacteria group bacterium]